MDENIIKRIQPHSPEAEQSVIGSMIMSEDAIDIAAEKITGEDFYHRQYGVLFDAMVELHTEGKPVDLITLQNRLQEKDVPPELAGIDAIREIMEIVPTSANVRQYAEIVYEKSVLRRLIKITEGITNECFQGKGALNDILADTEKKIFGLLQNQQSGEMESIKSIVMRTIDSIEAVAKNKGTVTGVETGFYDLDAMTAGFQKSDLIIVAARPSMGKTAFVLNIAEYAAVKHDTAVAIFSLEMSKDQLVKRILAMNSKVDSQDIRTGNLEDEDWAKLVESAATISRSKLLIDDTPGISVMELRSKCRKMKLEHNIGMIIIDYLQLMSGSKNNGESQQQVISDISRSLKAIAREINVPVIALSQLSRAVEQRPDKRPMLSDLRESGAIEQDADVVMFIYRDDYYNKDSEDKGISEIIIGKQRNGPTGTVKLLWENKLTKFQNLLRER
ncbi:MAG: replicative DNA helicase [Lachnospiraceae bacterium]|nr:replicative DNA helicase [Lachnospiraceae bacterium]